MRQDNSVITLWLGRERLQLIGIDRLHAMQSGWDEKRHSNAQWELHLVLQGSCRVDLEEESCQLRSGQAILIAPGQYHRPKADLGIFERLSLALCVQEGALARQLEEKCPGSLVIEPTGYMLQLAARILREHLTRQDFRQTAMKAMLSCFLVELFRLLQLSESADAGQQTTGSQITGIVDSYFEQHFADAAGEQVLADRLHISRRQLVRILQEHYGMNFRQKLIHARMDYAGWLLRTTDAQVSQICSTVGYSSEAAFFKTFRQHFGMTPNQYRVNKR